MTWPDPQHVSPFGRGDSAWVNTNLIDSLQYLYQAVQSGGGLPAGYDSGPVNVGPRELHTLTHALGHEPVIVTLWFRPEAGWPVWYAWEQGDHGGTLIAPRCSISTTTIEICTPYSYCCILPLVTLAYAQYQTGQMRVRAW